MHIVRRMMALCLSLLVLMMTTAVAEVPFLVHSLDWDWNSTPVEVLLKADVDTHMPFDDDRLAMLTPITDMLSLRLVTGPNEGSATISVEEEDVLTLQYRGDEIQLSCVPDTIYQAESDPLNVLLGVDSSNTNVYAALGLAPEGESLLTDGRMLLEVVPEVLEKYGKRSANTTNISGYGKAAYRMDYSVSADQMDVVMASLLTICPDGWLKDLMADLTFSGTQTLRIYYTKEDVLLRAEYNGICGGKDDLRTVKLVYKLRHDDEMDKDYIELTSPAKKGKDKNNLTFERTVETNKKGQRVINASFSYQVIEDGISSIRKGEVSLNNAYTDTTDVVTGSITLQYKLNDAEKYDEIMFLPDIVISGSDDSPVVNGTVTVTEKYASKVTEQAVITLALKRADEMEWYESFYTIDLSMLNEEEVAEVQKNVMAAVTTAIVRPLILKMGAEADWFFRDLPVEAVQAIVDAAAAAE